MSRTIADFCDPGAHSTSAAAPNATSPVPPTPLRALNPGCNTRDLMCVTLAAPDDSLSEEKLARACMKRADIQELLLATLIEFGITLGVVEAAQPMSRRLDTRCALD